mgnify:CR=1 FL=1
MTSKSDRTWHLLSNRVLRGLLFVACLIHGMSFAAKVASAQPQDPVLAAAKAAKRLERPILFQDQAGYTLFSPREGKSQVAFRANSPITSASLSNDGNRLALGSYDGGQRRIWVRDLADDPQPLTSDHAPNYLQEVGFSPDDWFVAYQITGHTVGEDVLYLLDLQAKRHWQITPEGMASKYFSWSPDGKHLALGLVFDQKTEVFGDMLMVEQEMDVVILDVATRQFRRVTHTGHAIHELAWSPDGKWIAFKSPEGLSIVSTAVAAERDKSGEDAKPRLLIQNISKEGPPRWSPDSQSLAVSRHASKEIGSNDQLIVVPLDGEPTSYEIAAQIWYYDFSPAGDAIALSASDRNLSLLNLKTKERSVLVNDVGFWSPVAWASRR